MLIINKILGINDLHPKCQLCSDVYKIWHEEQIEHANYEKNCLELMALTQHYKFEKIWSQH